MEQIKAMFDEMSKNDAFCGEMQALIKGGDPAAIIGLAGEKGFAFTEEDWNAYLDWSKGLSKPSKELSPEELENISGGGIGTMDDPIVGECWFHAATAAQYKFGHNRKRCNQFACKTWTGQWHICQCYGTDRCVDNWHYEEDCRYYK